MRSQTLRYDPARALCAALLLASLPLAACREPIDATGSDSAVIENAREGSTEWAWAYPPVHVAAASELAVWASPYSAMAGDTLDVFVHRAPTARHSFVHVQLFRLGWYAGRGGRLVWEDYVQAAPQESCTPPHPGPVVCPWTRTLRLPLDKTWLSGMYIIRVTDSHSAIAYYPFVVRDGRQAAIVAVIPVLTWQAYNLYGGSSLYTPEASSPGGTVTRVSFERPYALYGLAGTNSGLGQAEKGLLPIRFLERHGYDVTYISDADLATAGDAVADQARAIVFLGHSEYWSWAMYDRVEALRDTGHHLFFMSGNNAYWNVQLEPGRVLGRARNVVHCDKTTLNSAGLQPADVTGLFRDAPLNRPENALYGVMFRSIAYGGGTFSPLVVSDSGVGPEARAFLDAAGLAPGDQLPGLVYAEGDEIVDNGRTPSNLQVLFRSPTLAGPDRPSRTFYTTFFIAPGGAGVFASGTNTFPLGLDPDIGAGYDVRIERLTAAILNWMLAR